MHVDGSVIMSRRFEYNMSQEILYRKTGVSVSTLCRLEKGRNVGFINVMKVLRALDLTADEVIVINTPSVDAEIMSELDQIRNEGSYHLIEETLKKLTLVEWRSSRRLSVYYDWHHAIMCERAGNYNKAIKCIDKALKSLDDKISLEPLKVELLIAKGNVLNKNGDDGLNCYVEAGHLYARNANSMFYKTGIKLYYNVMVSYCHNDDYGEIPSYIKKASNLLDQNESTFMLKKINHIKKLARRKLNEG